jgi:hypothetical protein
MGQTPSSVEDYRTTGLTPRLITYSSLCEYQTPIRSGSTFARRAYYVSFLRRVLNDRGPHNVEVHSKRANVAALREGREVVKFLQQS